MTMNDLRRHSDDQLPVDVQLQALLERHGELMTAKELTALFRFGSGRAFRRAAEKGSLPVNVVRIPGRRGWFAKTRALAAWLASLNDQPSLE